MEDENTPKLEERESEQPVEEQGPAPPAPISAAVVERLRAEQNLPSAIAGGLAAAIVCAILWAVITVIAERQIGFMALGVGIAVGLAVRITGRGLDRIFGVTGAVLSILSVLIGNVLAIAGLMAKIFEVPLAEVFGVLTLDLVVQILREDFELVDLLFYGLAAYEGYKLAFRQVKQADVDRLSTPY